MSQIVEDKCLSFVEASDLYHKRQKISSEKVSIVGTPRVRSSAILKDFWEKHRSGQPSIGLLKSFSDIVVDPISAFTLSQRRASFDSIKNKKFPLNYTSKCFVCNELATVRHHILLLKHGGPVSSPKNLVSLCNKCHAEVHPWLVYDKPMLLADFRLAQQKNASMSLFDRAAKGHFDKDALEKAELELLNYFRSVFNILQNNF